MMSLQREFIWRMQKTRITAKQRFKRRIVVAYERVEKNTETERISLEANSLSLFFAEKGKTNTASTFFAVFNLQMRRGLNQNVASVRRSSEYDCHMSKHRCAQNLCFY